MSTIHHRTTAAPRGLQGARHVPAERIRTSEYGDGRSPGGSGTLIWALVASVLAASTVAFGAPLQTSYIYGIDDDSRLWVMALSGTSGSSQFLGTSVLTGSNANGLAYDRTREQLFGADTSTKELYWWQQGATSYTSLGSIAPYTEGIGQPQSAAFFNDAYWFLGGGSTGNVLGKLELDYSGGVPTIISGTTFVIGGMSSGASGGGDMVITPGGTLYAFSAPGVGNFFSANLASIQSGTVGDYNLIRSGISGLESGLQLALGVDGTTLYGQNFDSGTWYLVDPNTGNTTLVPDFTTTPFGGKGFRDLGGSSIQAVPEPDTLALSAMAGGVIAWHVSRQRKRRERAARPGFGRPAGPPETGDLIGT